MSNHSCDDLSNITSLPANVGSNSSPQNDESSMASVTRKGPAVKPDPSPSPRTSTRARKSKRPSASNANDPSSSSPNEFTVHKHDVLSGRGVNIAQHLGNERFRTLITSYTDEQYCAKYSVNEKKAAAKQIILHIQSLNPPGRFLKREGKGGVSRGLSGPWEELSDKDAIKKTCQALRDCNRLDRSGYADGVKAPEDVKHVVEIVTKTGLSAKERAAAAAAAENLDTIDEHYPSQFTFPQQAISHAPLNHASRHSSHSDLMNNQAFNHNNDPFNSSKGTKRTRDEVDKEYYTNLYKHDAFAAPMTEAQNSMDPPPDVAHAVDSLSERMNRNLPTRCSSASSANNDPTAYPAYYTDPSSTHDYTAGSGPNAYPEGGYYPDHNGYQDLDYSDPQYDTHHGYHPQYQYGYYPPQNNNCGSDPYPPPNYHPAAYPEAARAYHDDPSQHQQNQYHDHANPYHHPSTAFDSYHNKYNNGNTNEHKRDTNQSHFRPEDTWPLKKQRTDDSDPSTGMSTSASSPSTPAALMNNAHLGIPNPEPIVRTGRAAHGIEDMHVSEFPDDFVYDGWEGPGPGGGAGVVNSGDGLEDLNADELFSFE